MRFNKLHVENQSSICTKGSAVCRGAVWCLLRLMELRCFDPQIVCSGLCQPSRVPGPADKALSFSRASQTRTAWQSSPGQAGS